MARLLSSLTRRYKARDCVFTHAAQPSTTIIPLSKHFLLASPKSSSLLMDSNSPDFAGSSSCSSTKIQLYSYWQSSCSWRVRFALNLKELPYEYKAVDLSKGEQFSSEFDRLNPVHFVPVLVEGDLVVSDSFSILLYLDEKYPQNALLPVDVKKKALNLQVAGIIGSSIQPLHMQSVLNYLDKKAYPEDTLSWAQHYVIKGFTALEKLLKGSAGNYATGDEVFMADVFLAPQISVATTRFNIDMSSFPTLNRIYEAYKVLPAFQASVPERQPDAKVVVTGDAIFPHLANKLSELKVQSEDRDVKRSTFPNLAKKLSEFKAQSEDRDVKRSTFPDLAKKLSELKAQCEDRDVKRSTFPDFAKKLSEFKAQCEDRDVKRSTFPDLAKKLSEFKAQCEERPRFGEKIIGAQSPKRG